MHALQSTLTSFANQRRAGLTSLEVLVAATLLTVLIATIAPVAGRIYQISHQTRQYQFATNAVANQIDRILTTPVPERPALFESMSKISSDIESCLPEASWTIDTISDQFGKRVRVSLHWNAGKRDQSVSLIAWLDAKGDIDE